MTTSYDRLAFGGVADALTDSVALHRAAAKAADEPALAARLAQRGDRLQTLISALREPDDARSGSFMQHLDRAKLLIDQAFGDDDEAASRASSESKQGLVSLIDDHLRSPELSNEARDLLISLRSSIAAKGVAEQSSLGLADLPN